VKVTDNERRKAMATRNFRSRAMATAFGLLLLPALAAATQIGTDGSDATPPMQDPLNDTPSWIGDVPELDSQETLGEPHLGLEHSSLYGGDYDAKRLPPIVCAEE